jgi:predicted acylesterase/phospholipase RssA
MLPHRIYLSGGGICTVAHVGALMELSNRMPLKAVKEWMGVSAGSFIAMCLCIGFTLDELYKLCVEFDFTNIKEYDSVPGWLIHFGIDTGERLHKLIEELVLDKTTITKEQIEDVHNHKRDWYMSSEEALKYKIIDQII